MCPQSPTRHHSTEKKGRGKKQKKNKQKKDEYRHHPISGTATAPFAGEAFRVKLVLHLVLTAARTEAGLGEQVLGLDAVFDLAFPAVVGLQYAGLH